jgi:hypothetical protein
MRGGDVKLGGRLVQLLDEIDGIDGRLGGPEC